MDDLKNNEEFQRAMAEARRQWEEENRQKGGGLLNFVNQQPTVVKIIMFFGGDSCDCRRCIDYCFLWKTRSIG